jgi:redox-sensing transcriptional repressor
MSQYLRQLEVVIHEGRQTVSSKELSRRLGVTDSLVRKDLARLGLSGCAGVGFPCQELLSSIRKLLGIDSIWPVAVVGCGNLGRALIGYRGFSDRGFRIAAAFDLDPQLIGRHIGTATIEPFSQFASIVKAKGILLAALCVPAVAAQPTAERIIASGITGILNFAPVILDLPDRVSVAHVDFTIELEQLIFAVVQSKLDRL